MKCSAYIATSLDGFIAHKDGNIDWLDTAGKPDAEMGEDADMGFFEFINSVDCIIMGRKTMEWISDMNLSDDQWPYGFLKIIVLSKTLKEPPLNLKDKIEIYSGDINDLIKKLDEDGYCKAFIDGGNTIQSFMNLKLLNEITLTKAPVILSSGISLFEKVTQDVKFEQATAVCYPNEFIQEHYTLKYL